jgi:uncharacterized protein YyaL (SSP411 family)
MLHSAGSRYPWGQEAFDKARKENKPIFLSGNTAAFPGGGCRRVLWALVSQTRGQDLVSLAVAPQPPLPALIFLPSIPVGYSTCHWCHMMEEESFQNEEIGRLLSEDFVSVKVDREERPDVDKVYMTFVQVSRLPLGVLATPVGGQLP